MSNELELRLAKRIRSDLIGLESDEEIFEKTLQLLHAFFIVFGVIGLIVIGASD